MVIVFTDDIVEVYQCNRKDKEMVLQPLVLLISALFLSTPSLHLPLHIFSLYLLSSLSSAFPFFTSSVNITSPILHLYLSLSLSTLPWGKWNKMSKMQLQFEKSLSVTLWKICEEVFTALEKCFVSQPIKAGWFNIQNTSVSHCTYRVVNNYWCILFASEEHLKTPNPILNLCILLSTSGILLYWY